MDFSTKFVCEDTKYSTYEKNVHAPLFRKSFMITKEIDSAGILICGLGFYDLFINGQKITKGYLAPYISNSDHILYYDQYDIKKYIRQGENVIGIMLGDGYQVGKTSTWDFKDNITNSPPLLALTAQFICGDEILSFESDDFVCKKGPIIFNDLRSGVFYDARLEEKGWNAPGFKEINWHKPISGIYKPRGYAKLCEAEPIKVYREIKPKSIIKGELEPYKPSTQLKNFLAEISPFETCADTNCGYIYDFGENNSGIFRLKIRGVRGQKISLQCSEQLIDGKKLCYNNIGFYPDGFSQRDIYYLKGDDEEIFEPMFTYHGFRYVYVSGITEKQATEDLLTYLVMSSDLEERGSFECSDETANTIYQMGRRSDMSNFFYFPTDCPQREKNGWTGDASVSAEHMIMTIGVENSWREWLNNIRAAQREDGVLPGIIPTDKWSYEFCNGPAWDSVLFNLPYYAYKYRGETRIIEENASAMFRYLEYISRRRNERGIVAIGLGDWLPVVRREGKQSDAELGFTDSVMVLDMCRKSTEMFEKINLPLHMKFAKKLGQEILASIRSEYIDVDTFVVRNRCQTSQAMAIYYNVFEEDEMHRAFDVLMDIIKEDNESITSGLLGLRVIFHVLAQFGKADIAYKMITKKEYPSYGYWAEKGETTFLEKFKDYDDYFPNSKNHHYLGDVVNWFMSCPGGIKVQNSNEVIIKPSFIKSLEWCKTVHKLLGGSVEVFWKRTENGIELNVSATEKIHYKVELESNHIVQQVDLQKYLIKGSM